jgi:hypothetical protein
MSRRTVSTLVATFAAIASDASAMSNYRWTYRPLIVFADGASSAALTTQRGIVATSRTGLAERRVVVVWVIGTNVRSELGPKPALSAGALRARYGVATGSFRAVLVGKDGGVKLSQRTPLSARRMFTTIDAMPMRQQEMRAR